MTKKNLRAAYRKKRMEISATDQMKWDDLLLIRFQQLDLPFMDQVMSFYPMEQYNEVNTLLFTSYLHFKNPNLHISYPRTHPGRNTMDAILCGADSIFEPNEFNIPEPVGSEIVDPQLLDLVIVPLLIFDTSGYRVGYGKGYYDRFLKSCRPDCLNVGFSYFDPVEEISDRNEFDIPLDVCITPDMTYTFR